MLSAGGALGGIFVGLICPLIFPKPFELTISIVASFVVGCVALLNAGKATRLGRQELLQWSSAFVVVGLVFLVGAAQLAGLDTNTGSILHSRNFYGTIWVKETKDKDDEGNDTSRRSLYHGRILHGTQYQAEDRMDEATTYYDDVAGPGVAVRDYPGWLDGQPIRVAVVGLGTGTMAAHARNSDYYCFYDIDPKVVALHEKLFQIGDKQEHVFKFLDRARARGATVEVTLGDARIQMEKESRDTAHPRNYDVLVLDAFSGDAIPAHLLTDESFGLYERHLRHEERVDEKTGEKTKVPMGIIVVHISNRYLDLEPVVAAIAKKHGYRTWRVHKTEEGGPTDTASDWILVSKNDEFMDNPKVKDASEPLAPAKELLWTDQFTALYPIMK